MAGRTLFIDACTPTPDQDSGSRTALDLITSFQRAGYKATFVADNLAWVPRYTADLELQDIKCLYSPYATSLEDHLKQFGRCYDLIVIFRAPIALKFLYLARQYAPQAKIIFHTIDLHYLREQREAELRGSHDQLASITLHKAQELAMVLASDCTIVVSQFEKDLLAQELPRANVYLFPYVMDVTGCRRSFGVRQDLVFLGGYRHPPNVDAVCYFVDKVFPLIRRILPEVRFLVVGSHAPPEVLRLAESDGIEVVGQVPDLAPYFEKCRLSVAPLRYGAGIKGKVVTSLSFGLPCVATSIAVEGMAVEHGKEVLIADDPHAFAERVIDVYTKPDLWQSLSQAALRFVERNYSRAVALQHVQAILASIGLVCPKRSKEEEPLRVAA